MERRILPVATLIALWIGAAYFTYASWKGGVFEVPGSGRSFTQLVAYHVKGIFMLYGPYMLASVAIVIGRNSLFVVVVTWFMAACTAFFITLDLSYSGQERLQKIGVMQKIGVRS